MTKVRYIGENMGFFNLLVKKYTDNFQEKRVLPPLSSELVWISTSIQQALIMHFF